MLSRLEKFRDACSANLLPFLGETVPGLSLSSDDVAMLGGLFVYTSVPLSPKASACLTCKTYCSLDIYRLTTTHSF